MNGIACPNNKLKPALEGEGGREMKEWRESRRTNEPRSRRQFWAFEERRHQDHWRRRFLRENVPHLHSLSPSFLRAFLPSFLTAFLPAFLPACLGENLGSQSVSPIPSKSQRLCLVTPKAKHIGRRERVSRLEP